MIKKRGGVGDKERVGCFCKSAFKHLNPVDAALEEVRRRWSASCQHTTLNAYAGAREHTHAVNTQCCALQDGTTALQMAGQNGHAEVVQLLLDSQADANLADEVRQPEELSRLS